MPLNAKGKKIKAAMEAEYGTEKGKRVFYASENKGTVRSVTGRTRAVHNAKKNLKKAFD